MIRLAVRVRREDAELVLAQLLEHAPSGVEESEAGQGVVEYAVYGSPGELPRLPDLRAAAGAALVEVATSELPDDWGERWKRFHRPVLIEPPVPRRGADTTPGLHIRPPWEPPCERPHVEEIVIDPGQAFGTGAHATTRMCLQLLLELAADAAPQSGRGPLLDLGTGSGVLAIAAARLGFAPVLGLDHECESVAAARENALDNGVEIEVRSFDLRREPLPALAAGAGLTVLANLLKPLLLHLARSIACPPSDLIVGGLLREQVEEVVGAFESALNMRERERRCSGEWAAVWLAGSD